MSIFFTADTHYWHNNIISYCNRPWKDVEEMNEGLIENSNKLVGVDDTLVHVGDFSFAGKQKTRDLIARLNGHLILIMGNHDFNKKPSFWLDAGFEHVEKLQDGALYQFEEFNLCHLPYRAALTDYDVREYLYKHSPLEGTQDKVLLHGHVHNRWRVEKGMINVGVDVWNFHPVSIERVRVIAPLADPQLAKYPTFVVE